jgi:hypothetical protein
MALPRSQRGQISIFFSASLVVFISIIAFVINVGLFVKAKINLQNATDAAAFAGAAVQSRQLTKIAYLNWEMRNIYKEWMYKYYVVGMLNAPGVEKPDENTMTCKNGNCTDFRLEMDKNAISGIETKDDYNFPATCIHIAGSKTNICKRFAVPGLPEFGGYSIPGTEEASRSFVDTLVGSKIDDCVERSKLNMLVTTTWAYNVLSNGMDETLAGRGPAILTDRQGAWPRAMEVGMRIRNLEKVMNRKPVDGPVCIGGGSCESIETFANDPTLGNERIVKAFYSAYRNLGNESDNEMKNSFQLTELKPNPMPIANQYNTSNLLIPNDGFYEKSYVDLKLMMVNLATFYAALIPRADSATSGACDISKVAIPVPGYPLGFYKNPKVVTYYAVKGEAEFEGMFNPFSTDKIKLTAYAAAKPAGGRIGPMLFVQKDGENVIRSRQDTAKYRSVPYISSLNVEGTFNRFLPAPSKLAKGQYGPGVPLPINLDENNPFWLTEPTQPIGGLPDSGTVMFGIPNLVYDFQSIDNFLPDSYSSNNESLHMIAPAEEDQSVMSVGLYNPDQFKKFRGAITGIVTTEQLNDQISRVRAATMYEAANYMIPTPNELNFRLNVDSFGTIAGTGRPLETEQNVKKYSYDLYAPLYQEGSNQKDILYSGPTAVLGAMVNFMLAQEPAMQNYVNGLNSAALQTYKTSFLATAAATGAQPRYRAAAMKISDIEDFPTANPSDVEVKTLALSKMPQSCDSLSGQFWHFYFGGIVGVKQINNLASCPKPLKELLQLYYASAANDTAYNPRFYKMDYNLNESNFEGKIERIFSAYMPGPWNGVSPDGKLIAPPGFPAHQELMRRNFYSTKLISLDSVQSSGIYRESNPNFVIYSEGEVTATGSLERSQREFINVLDSTGLTDIKH